MLNKKYLTIVLFLTSIFVLVSSLIMRSSKLDKLNPTIDDTLKGGWVEVFSGKAEIVNDKENRKEILTGDIVEAGDKIEVSLDGNISIRLFDGSVLRASDGAIFSINSAEYDKSSNKLTLDVNLSNGKIWSKIIELATPDSLWSVETSNTVATVRGSAFGISTDGKTSEVFGSQHKVYIDLIDPVSRKKIKSDSIMVEEDSFLVISNEDIEKIKKVEEKISSTTPTEMVATIRKETENMLVPRKKNDEMKKVRWIRENEIEDENIEKEVSIIKKEAGSQKEEFKKILNKKVEDRLQEAKNNKKKSSIKKEDKSEKPSVIKPDDRDLVKRENIKKIDIPELKPIEPAPNLFIKKDEGKKIDKWTDLKIETLSDIRKIIEGEMVTFRAIIRGENNEEKDVTRDAKWQVLGQIGLMSRAGTFSAKLDQSIAEYGEGFGFIVATWQDENGEQFLGKTEEVRVIIKADTGPIPEEFLLTQ